MTKIRVSGKLADQVADMMHKIVPDASVEKISTAEMRSLQRDKLYEPPNVVIVDDTPCVPVPDWSPWLVHVRSIVPHRSLDGTHVVVRYRHYCGDPVELRLPDEFSAETHLARQMCRLYVPLDRERMLSTVNISKT